jgi:hypothetical protein
MKKTTIHLSALAGLFYLILLLPLSACAQVDSMKIGRTILPSFITRGTKMSVTIFIDKGYVGGVAELDEVIPPGFIISEGDKNGAEFSVVGDTLIRYVWQSMPSEPGFTVSYHLTVPADALGKYPMVARFKFRTSTGDAVEYFKPYLFTVKLPFDTGSAVVTQNPVVEPEMNSVVNSSISNKPPKVSPAPNPKKAVAVKKAPPAPTVAHRSIPVPVAPVPPSDTKTNGLYYRVQIMASANRLQVDSVIINGIRDKLYIITRNGISRYYIGAFHELQPAKDYRDRIMSNGLKGPFVVAYKNGQKITIRESLQVVATN